MRRKFFGFRRCVLPCKAVIGAQRLRYRIRQKTGYAPLGITLYGLVYFIVFILFYIFVYESSPPFILV